MAPRVEKTKVLKGGSNLTYFPSCIMKKNIFFYGRKEQRPYFTMKLFSAALSYLTGQSTLNFT